VSRNRNLEWALFYASECAVPVFPVHGTVANLCDCGQIECRNPGKHPRTQHGLKDATFEIDQVRAWWSQWPTANIGMPTGQHSLYWVLDIDLPDGEKSFEKLVASQSVLPDTATSVTGSGGRQLFFLYHTDTPVYNTSSSIAPNLDVRGEGGYVILPPSRHITGRNYHWQGEHSLKQLSYVEAPQWLVKASIEASKRARGKANGAAYDGQVLAGARNDYLYRKARALRAKRFKQPVVIQAILAENAVSCAPPLDVTEVQKIVDNAFKQPHRVDFEQQAQRDGKEIVAASDPLLIARTWAKRYIERQDGRLLHRWDQRFWRWNGAHYDGLLDEDMRAPLWAYLRDEVVILNDAQKPVQPSARMIADVSDALRAAVNIPLPKLRPPGWIGASPLGISEKEILSVKNGLLHMTSGELLQPSPKFFTLTSVQADYDPQAQHPQWSAFLQSIFPADQEQIETLQEVMGYLLTTEMEQQKIFMIIGPPRSGKGTIGNVMQMLLGDNGVARLSSGKFAQTFGLAGLIGRQLAILSDTRITESSSELIERLLTISGQDSIDVDRKFREDWQGKLNTRFLFLTNELPLFWDASGALFSRFLVLETRISFLGNEDHDLASKLRSELSGILNWSIVGWRRLKARGHFVQPQTVDMTLQQFAALSSPVREFIDVHYRLAEKAEVFLAEMYANYKRWSEAQGQVRSLPENVFARNLRAAIPSVIIKRETIKGVKKRVVVGLETIYWEPDSKLSEDFDA